MDFEYKKINTKEQLLLLIQDLSAQKSSDWENLTTKDFLEALGAWLESADGFYNNLNLDTDPTNPSWQLFADALQAATIYE